MRNTKDPEEYKRKVQSIYDSMASSYNSYFEKGALKVLNEIIRRNLFAVIKKHHIKILDAGGGDGKLGLLFAKEGHNVTVVDISHQMLDKGRKRALKEELKGNISFIEGDLENLAFFEDNFFDFIICEGSVLSFLPNPNLALKEFYRIIKPGGEMIISVQNRLFFMWLGQSIPIMKSVWKTGRVYPQINAGADYKCSSHSFTPNEFSECVENAGLQIKRLGSRYMVANRLNSEERLDKDPLFFEEVVNMELSMAWDENFISFGRILTILATK